MGSPAVGDPQSIYGWRGASAAKTCPGSATTSPRNRATGQARGRRAATGC